MKRAIAMSLLVCMTLAVTLSVVQAEPTEPKEKIKAFEKEWSSRVPREKNEAVKALPNDSKQYLESYIEILKNEHWMIREQGMVNLATATPDVLEGLVEEARDLNDKKDDERKLRAHIIFTLCVANQRNDATWDYVREVLVNVDEDGDEGDYAVSNRIEAALHMSNNYGEEVNKPNFEALFAVLKQLLGSTEEDSKKADKEIEKKRKVLEKDKGLRHLKWLVVYAMEKLTSQRHGDLVNGWQIWWDGAKDGPILYRNDGEAVSTEVEGVEVKGRQYAREKQDLPTDLELLILPSVEFYGEWMEPYMYEFTKYFNVTMLRMPDASKMKDLKRPTDRNGTPDPNAYYQPVDRIYKIFEARRKEKGGNVGMIALGATACFMAMEYAKNQPDGIQFIVCVGAYSGNDRFNSALESARNQGGDSTLQWYAAILRTYYGPNGPREAFTEDQQFEAQIGRMSHLVFDPYSVNNIRMNQIENQVNAKRRKEMEESGERPSGQASLIDGDYVFEGKKIKTPALFFYSKNDKLGDKGSPNKLKGMFSNAHLVELEDTAAVPYVEDPMGFIENFKEFMDEEEVWEKIKKDRKKDDE